MAVTVAVSTVVDEVKIALAMPLVVVFVVDVLPMEPASVVNSISVPSGM